MRKYATRMGILVLFVFLSFARRANADRVDDLSKQLKSDDTKVRLSAALNLGKLGDKRAIPALTAALSDSDKNVRGIAAAALGRLVDGTVAAEVRNQAISELQRVSQNDTDSTVKKQASNAYTALKALQTTDNNDEWAMKIIELMDAVDSYIPIPERAVDKPFLMPVEDIFSISGRGTVVTGRIERGVVKVGEEVEIVGIRPTQKKVVTGVEMFRKLLDQGQAGDNVGLLLRGVERKDVERGQVCAKPGSITPHTKFKAEVYILTKEEGGRHTPFFNGYRPQFYFRTTDITGTAELTAGAEMVMPGDNTSLTMQLINPIAMEKGLRFAIREGGRTVGAGTVTDILE